MQNQKIMFVERQQARLVPEMVSIQPTPTQVVGKTLVSVVSSGSETGGYMDFFGGGQFPCPTGYAGVLEVIAVGNEVRGITPGDRVFAQSNHQLISVMDQSDVIRVPNDMKSEHAVLCRFPAISMTTMIHTQIRPTEPVLVTGLGAVGLVCAQMMRHCGYDVCGVDPSPVRRGMAERCGIRHTCASLEDLGELKGRFGLAMECSGVDQAMIDAANYVRKGGELSIVGVPWRRSSDTYAHTLFETIFMNYVKIYSGWEWSLPLHSADFFPNSNFHSFTTAMEWIRQGSIQVEGTFELFDPANCSDIYRTIANGKLETVFAIFDWRQYV